MKTAAALSKLLDDLRKRMGRKGGGAKEGEDRNRELLGALHTTVVTMLETAIQSAEARKKSDHQPGDFLIDFDRRITALEKAISKKKPRKPTKRKRRG